MCKGLPTLRCSIFRAVLCAKTTLGLLGGLERRRNIPYPTPTNPRRPHREGVSGIYARSNLRKIMGSGGLQERLL